MLLTPRTATFSGTKQTSEVFNVGRGSYIDYFTYRQCEYCMINDYSLSGVADGMTIGIADGTISTTMGVDDISTSFDLVPSFSDVRCNPLFDPASLRVTLVIDHTCTGEEDIVSVIDAAPLVILDQVESGEFYTIVSAEDYFNHTTPNIFCGISSIGLFRDSAGADAFGTVIENDGNYEL